VDFDIYNAFGKHNRDVNLVAGFIVLIGVVCIIIGIMLSVLITGDISSGIGNW